MKGRITIAQAEVQTVHRAELPDRPSPLGTADHRLRDGRTGALEFRGASDLGRFLTDSWDDTLESEARVFNIGNPANRTTVRGLAERVKALLNSGSKIVHADGKEVYGPMYEEAESFEKVTVLKAAFELGREPRVGLDELVLETADYQTHEDYREARESSRVTYATV